MAKNLPDKPLDYQPLLDEFRERIQRAQLEAAQSVNKGMVLLYWSLGRDILKRQQAEGWGAKVIDQLAKDLRTSFPDMRGLSSRNLKYMRAVAAAWPEEAIVQQLLHKLPWFHLCTLLDKVKEPDSRLWYARSAIEHGWSRNVMVHHIKGQLFDRKGSAPTNFKRTLPAIDSELATQTIKDPYKLDFLTLSEDAKERDLEQALVSSMRDFLIELGEGFAFVGNQVHMEIGDQDFYLDLLFYHLRLRRYIIFELKAGDFKPEHVGKLNFYVSAADDILRHADDKPTLGVLLCRTKNKVVAEYALRGATQPMGVSEFVLTEEQLQQLDETLPPIAQGGNE